jgi:hypothetical protein
VNFRSLVLFHSSITPPTAKGRISRYYLTPDYLWRFPSFLWSLVPQIYNGRVSLFLEVLLLTCCWWEGLLTGILAASVVRRTRTVASYSPVAIS